jgi:hypothetical protein
VIPRNERICLRADACFSKRWHVPAVLNSIISIPLIVLKYDFIAFCRFQLTKLQLIAIIKSNRKALFRPEA